MEYDVDSFSRLIKGNVVDKSRGERYNMSKELSYIMHRFVEATYKNGELLLDEKLNMEFEGKKLKLIIFTDEEGQEQKKENFFNFANRHSFKLPGDYSFNREELYQR
jgi:predicted DNA-binding antitoxin AbrB/MazE fold protein